MSNGYVQILWIVEWGYKNTGEVFWIWGVNAPFILNII
jgi:hypothetical protein